MASNKRVEILGGAINYYERGYDSLYHNVRVLRKKISGVGLNNKVLNLRLNPIYGTKTAWTNTVVDCYVNKVIFEYDGTISVWSEAIINSDEEFIIKVYEKHLDPTAVNVYVSGSANYYYNGVNRIDLTLSGIMSGTALFGVEQMSVRMITYKDNVVIQNNYAESDIPQGTTGATGFTFSVDHQTNTTHNYRIQIIFDEGNGIRDPTLDANLTGNEFLYVNSENNSTEAIFYAYEK